ncbi:MAG: hypothetical protein NTX49_01595 [Chlamydiae bacterium]|nr:hypothetical protein [Chlamydiota bacterium]
MSSSAVDFRGALAPLVETCTSNNRCLKTVASGLGMLAFASIQMGGQRRQPISETYYRETKPKNTIWFGDSICPTRALALKSLERDSGDVFTKAAGSSSLKGGVAD